MGFWDGLKHLLHIIGIFGGNDTIPATTDLTTSGYYMHSSTPMLIDTSTVKTYTINNPSSISPKFLSSISNTKYYETTAHPDMSTEKEHHSSSTPVPTSTGKSSLGSTITKKSFSGSTATDAITTTSSSGTGSTGTKPTGTSPTATGSTGTSPTATGSTGTSPTATGSTGTSPTATGSTGTSPTAKGSTGTSPTAKGSTGTGATGTTSDVTGTTGTGSTGSTEVTPTEKPSLTRGAVAGIVIGSLLAVAIITAAIVFVVKQRNADPEAQRLTV